MPGTGPVDLSKDRAEFSEGALELHKIASVQFHHLTPAQKKESARKQPSTSTLRWTEVAIRRYTDSA